jgi:O-6-methylguanine DNA methyltransferase
MTCRIPRGKVATYGSLARAIASPQASRAVGGALHRNPYAPAVPCHRVVASDGRLTGYAGGLDKKRQLLMQEGVVIVGDRVSPESFWQFDHVDHA